MVYVPKDTVVEFMKKVSIWCLIKVQIEKQSNERIAKYQKYAQDMKLKFADYEIQSEKYYQEMLTNFKKHAKEQMLKKQKTIDVINGQIKQHQEKIERITERIHEKKLKGMLSDESDEDEEPDKLDFENKTVTIEEYQFVKSKRRQIKLTLKKWVTEFQAKNKRLPNDADTAIIAADIMDFNFVNTQYLAYKLKLIKQ